GAERVRLERAYDPRDPVIMADAGRLEQAVLNLLTNAVEAMPGGGTLRVATEARDGEVALSVQDTGVGISAENLNRILKPFFSTKPGGTGLGLPLVARVVAAHGGQLDVESEPGRGTVFHVRLPSRPPGTEQLP
ncbi:MAG TPA: ATP-binding protein, partial [Gemmatimonadales bacterium]|nr:ATP-binding protein [Gemmatimonadales bacterium]